MSFTKNNSHVGNACSNPVRNLEEHYGLWFNREVPQPLHAGRRLRRSKAHEHELGRIEAGNREGSGDRAWAWNRDDRDAGFPRGPDEASTGIRDAWRTG